MQFTQQKCWLPKVLKIKKDVMSLIKLHDVLAYYEVIHDIEELNRLKIRTSYKSYIGLRQHTRAQACNTVGAD